jgi:hypothetical protein
VQSLFLSLTNKALVCNKDLLNSNIESDKLFVVGNQKADIDDSIVIVIDHKILSSTNVIGVFRHVEQEDLLEPTDMISDSSVCDLTYGTFSNIYNMGYFLISQVLNTQGWGSSFKNPSETSMTSSKNFG